MTTLVLNVCLQPSSTGDRLEPSSFWLLVVRPGATSVASLLLVAMPFVTSSFLLLVVRPGATSGVLAPSSDALCDK